MKTLKEIVSEYLKLNGYDGLYWEGECGCELSDFMPCDNPMPECIPGVKYSVHGAGYDFEIGPRKAE